MAASSVSLAGPKGAAARALSWFLSLSTGADTPLQSLFQLLIGCWVAERGLEADDRKASVALARDIGRRLDGCDQAQVLAGVLECDAAAVLCCAGIMRAVGSECASLERFASQIGETLQALAEEPGEDSGLYSSRYLLHRLGLHSAPLKHSLDPALLAAEANAFLADGDVVRSVVADIAAATDFGRRPPSTAPDILNVLTAVIPCWFLFYLRQYNLELGTPVFRAAVYLNLPPNRAMRESLDFLVAQQQPDGRFGFLGPDLHKLRSAKAGLNSTWDVYLPITVSCLWAIAEATNPSFRLYDSF
jgi:hypothetical protein